MIDSETTATTITVLQTRGQTAHLLIQQATQDEPGILSRRTVQFTQDQVERVSKDEIVTVIDIRGDKVRIAIDAPKDRSVHRLEVYEAIRRENAAAARIKPEDLDGLAGAPVPRPTKPAPPSLDVRMDEPRSDEGG